MNTPVTTTTTAADMAGRVAGRADDAIVGTKRMVEQSARSMQNGLDDLRDTVPGAITRTAQQAEDLARRGIEQARLTADQVRKRAMQAGDMAVERIRADPLKSVLIAAAAGAATALLVQWLMSRRAQ